MDKLLFFVLTMFSLSTIFAANARAADAEVNANSDAAKQQTLQEIKNLSSDIQRLKLDIVALNNDLIQLEENLLYPSSTKYSVFVAMNSGEYFTLESVKLKINGKLVTTHLYDSDDRLALARGGVHKLFITNLSEGKHTATVFFTGLGPNKTPFKRASEVSINKANGQGFLEIAINDNGATQEPEFIIKKW